jgi:integrase
MATVKANKLALQYFSLLYGQMDTDKLQSTHMVRFFQWLQERKRLQKNDKGDFDKLSRYSIYKIMVKLRAYVRRLESQKLVVDLQPIDVPVGDVPRPIPKYLTKPELKQILEYLDQRVLA